MDYDDRRIGPNASFRDTTLYAHSHSPYYDGTHFAQTRSFERIHDSSTQYRSSSTSLPPPNLTYHSERSQSGSITESSRTMSNSHRHHQSSKDYSASRPYLPPDGDWNHRGRRRRDSTESSWSSSQSSYSMASPQLDTSPKSGGLQFQPLPASHLSSHFSRLQSNSMPQTPSSGLNSPFGVLIADPGVDGAPPSDPQRLAILRTLRASGSAITLSPAFEDFSNARAGLTTARYECPYCSKRFNRPSSLKANLPAYTANDHAYMGYLSQIHINGHTGEKRKKPTFHLRRRLMSLLLSAFQCSHPNCGRRFSVQSNMRRHMRVHSTPGLQVPDESSGDEESSQSTSTDTPFLSPQIRPTLKPLEMSHPKHPAEATESTPRPDPSPRRSRSAHALTFTIPQSHVRTSSDHQQTSSWFKAPSSR